MMPENTPLWDIKWTTCEPRCVDFGGITEFFNDPVTQKQLGVDSEGIKFTLDSKPVADHLRPDMVKSQIGHVADLLEAKVQVLIYTGANDYICNWIGGQTWTTLVDWSSKRHFSASAYRTWIGTDGSAGGHLRNYENFSYLIFNDAGHMV